jgi:hypothetical protein
MTMGAVHPGTHSFCSKFSGRVPSHSQEISIRVRKAACLPRCEHDL